MSVKGAKDKVLHGKFIEAAKEVKESVAHQMERSIGLAGVIIISLSAMLGSGLFVLPSLAGEMMGPGIWLAYILAAMVVLPGALSKSELSSAMPTSGGSYVFIERTFGPLLGTIAGLGLWASFLLKAAFALIGFSAYLEIISYALDTDINVQTLALGILVLIVIINILGIKKIKAFQAPIVGLSILMLIGLCIAALFREDVDLARPISNGAFGGGLLGLAETAAFVFVAYAGVTKVAAIAGEVKEPGQNLPNGMLISLTIATVLYAGVAYMLMATLPGEWWIGTDGSAIENPIYVFAKLVGGSTVAFVAAILAVLTMISMALAGVLAASRYLFGMGRDNLLPQLFEEVNATYETPHWPIIATGIMMAFAIIWMDVSDVAKLASGFQIMIFIVVNACVIILRKSHLNHEWYKPTYRSPLYPFTQLFGIFAGLALVMVMGEKAYIGAAFAIAFGFILFYSYGKQHAHPRLTPFITFTEMMLNPSKVEHERRVAAFHAADIGLKNHLTLREFQTAMAALGFPMDYEENRVIFHQLDLNQIGYIEIDDFIEQFEGEIRDN